MPDPIIAQTTDEDLDAREQTGVSTDSLTAAENEQRVRGDGGPAFPLFFPESKTREGKVLRSRDEHAGMSLRDYFAAKAMVEAIAHERELRMGLINPGSFRYEDIAYAAYVMADAMLAERARGGR